MNGQIKQQLIVKCFSLRILGVNVIRVNTLSPNLQNEATFIYRGLMLLCFYFKRKCLYISNHAEYVNIGSGKIIFIHKDFSQKLN